MTLFFTSSGRFFCELQIVSCSKCSGFSLMFYHFSSPFFWYVSSGLMEMLPVGLMGAEMLCAL